MALRHTDFLGSPVAETNSAGAVTRVERYTPYGEPADMQLDVGPGFTGHATDVATGLTYMQQRYFDAEIGRFISPDPVGPEEDFIKHFNRYNYAMNNPVRYTDPDGRYSTNNNWFSNWVSETIHLMQSAAYSDGAAISAGETGAPLPDPVERNNIRIELRERANTAADVITTSQMLFAPAAGASAIRMMSTRGAIKGVVNLIPEGKLANHLFKGGEKLADNPANRTLIQKLANGKPIVVDEFGTSWYMGSDSAGKSIYAYARDGIIKGAGYSKYTIEQTIAKYGKW